MKKFYLSFKMLLVACLLQISFTSSAQLPVSVGETLDGESVVSGAYFPWGGEIVATGNTLYSKSVTRGSVIVTADTSYERIWTTPGPGKIKQTYVKIKSFYDSTGRLMYTKESDNNMIVLMDNGDVYRLYVDHYDGSSGGTSVENVNFWNHAGTEGTEGYNKILGDDIYILSSAHLYYSSDSSTWHVDSAGLNGAHIYDAAMDTLQKLYVATDKGLFTQDTSANPFTKITTYTGPQNLSSIFIDRHNGFYLGANSNGTYYSANGTTWQIDTAGTGTGTPVKFADDVYGNVYCAVPVNNGSHLYKKAAEGDAWQLIDGPIYLVAVNPVAISSLAADSLVLVATNFGQFTSADAGVTWLHTDENIRSENITGLSKTNSGQILLSNALGINKKVGGDAWAKVYPQTGFAGNLPLYDDGLGNIYTIDNSGGTNLALGFLLKSNNGGDTWVPDTTGLSGIGGSSFFADEKGTLHVGNTFYSGTKPSEVWQKTVGGMWTIDTVGFPVLGYSFVESMASDKKGHLYVSGYFGGEKVMRRGINATQWTVDTAGIPAAVSYFNTISGAKGDVVGITNNALYHRGTGTWSKITLPAQATFPSVAAAGIDTSGYIFVALKAVAGSGVYFTKDLGAHWKYAGLDSASITAFVCYGDTTYVLTRNQGAFALNHQSALPVTLSSIKAYQLGKGIQVEWSGFNEINMQGYTVERSSNGAQFTAIGSVAAKNNNVAENIYGFFDGAPINGNNFYRIKVVSKDSAAQYSGIVKVNVQNGKSGMLVYPNPAANKTINVQLNNMDAGTYLLTIYNAAGQRVYATNVAYAGGSVAININSHTMAKGTYWVVLQGKMHLYNNKVVVQ